MLMSFLLSVHPMLEAVKTAPRVEPATCPFQIEMTSRNGEDEETAWLQVDPETSAVTRLDADGQPLEEEGPEDSEGAGNSEQEDDGETVSLGAFDYAKALSRLDLDLEEMSSTPGKLVLQASGLPKGTVDMNGKDISKRSSVTIVLEDDGAGPYLAEYVERLEKPVRMKVVAKIKDYERKVTFGRVQNSILPVEDGMRVALSAMGNEMDFGFSMAYTYLPCAGDEAVR